MAAFRFSSETIGEGIRVVLFVLAITALLFGLWPAIGGSVGVFAMAAESSEVQKEAGITTADWTTQEAPSLSWIHVHVEANYEVDVRIVAANHRSLVIQNVSGFAAQEDTSVVAGGGSTGPTDGIGTSLDLGGSRGGPVRYIISVRASDNSRIQNITDRDIEYTLTWEVQKLDPTVFLAGLVLFAMFFVTEYMLHIRADLRTLARRVDRMVSEGPAASRAPSAALGSAAAAPPFGFREGERPPAREGREEPSSAIPGGARADEDRRGGRRRLFGRSSTGQEVPPATEEEAVDEGPAPAVRDPYAPPPPTAAAAPPVAEEVPEPAYYQPPPAPTRSAQPPAPARRAAPPAPPTRAAPPAPPRQAAARPAAPPAAPAAEAVTRVRCPQCKHIVPVYTAQRPTPIKCPNCGKKGMLTR